MAFRLTPSHAWVLLGIAGSVLVACPAHAGKLDAAGRAARTGTSSGGSSSSRSSSSSGSSGSYSGSHGSSCYSCSSQGIDGGTFFVLILSSPWLLPHMALESRRAPGSVERTRFAPYPYAYGASGHIVSELPPTTLPTDHGIFEIDGAVLLGDDPNSTGTTPPDPPPAEPTDPGAEHGYPVAFQLSGETGLDLGGTIWRHQLGARFQFPWRLDVDTDWALFSEYTNKNSDHMVLGREHLALRFAESAKVQFRTGIGARHLWDSQGWVHGFDLTYGFDAFPARPIVLSAEGSLGSLGKAFAPTVRATLGVLIGPVEIAAGWDQRWISDVTFGGPLVALRGWL